MGFRVPGKVAKRLVEVGQTVDVGQPLATLDEVDLKLQAEQVRGRIPRRHRRAGAGRRRRAARQGSARQGLDHRMPRWTPAAPPPTRPRARAQPRRALGRADQEFSLLCDAGRRHPRRRHRDADRAGPGRGRRPDARSVSRASARRKRWSRSRRRCSARAKSGARHACRCGLTPTRSIAAKLREIAPTADPATRTYLAKFSLPDAGDDVSLGMTATLTLADAATERVAKLPLSALYSQGGDPSRLYRRRRRRGDAEAGHREVLARATTSSSPAASMRAPMIVALGVQKIDPAQKVRVVSSLSF